MSQFKVSRYFNPCYCLRPRKDKFLIVKFTSNLAEFGIGNSNVQMRCFQCKSSRHYRIDTWWGGTFTNKDFIYADTAKKQKILVSKIIDVSDDLMKEHVVTLKAKVTAKETVYKNSKMKLKKLEKLIKENKKSG